MDPDHGSSPAFDWFAHGEVLFVRTRETTAEQFDACMELAAKLHAEVGERIICVSIVGVDCPPPDAAARADAGLHGARL